MQFPKISGRNLEGRLFNLPSDFEAEYNIVLIAYTQWQQLDVDSWMPYLKELSQRFPKTKVYELPTVERMGFFRESLLDYWMRTGIPDKAIREATITLYTDVQVFNRQLNLANKDEIYLLVLRPSGELLWQTKGRYKENAALELKKFLAEHMPMMV